MSNQTLDVNYAVFQKTAIVYQWISDIESGWKARMVDSGTVNFVKEGVPFFLVLSFTKGHNTVKPGEMFNDAVLHFVTEKEPSRPVPCWIGVMHASFETFKPNFISALFICKAINELRDFAQSTEPKPSSNMKKSKQAKPTKQTKKKSKKGIKSSAK